jgi:RimJ/RimL family protein N-acetyltransferase
MSFVFYVRDATMPQPSSTAAIDSRYVTEIWTPAKGGLVPKDMPLKPFAIWWLFHTLGLFKNRRYAVCVIYDQERVVHRSMLFPGYFRFPFMTKDDLQVGDTWTAPEHRGQGLATCALQSIVRQYASTGRRLWYLVESDNLASIRVVEKAGFVRYAEGYRVSRWGLRVLGAYVIQNRL